MYKHFTNNVDGRDFVCGDVHGCYDDLMQLLDAVDFDRQRDRLFVVGDLIDRGPKNVEVVELLHEPWFFSILGNHELMMLCATMDRNILDLQQQHICQHLSSIWTNNGGNWWYDATKAPSKQKKRELVDLISKLPLIADIQIGDRLVGLVHAQITYSSWDVFRDHVIQSVPCDGNWPEVHHNDIAEESLWARAKVTAATRSRSSNPLRGVIEGVDHVFHGHTPNESVVVVDNCSYIDTGCFLHKHYPTYGLTMIDIRQYLDDNTSGIYTNRVTTTQTPSTGS